VQYYNDTIAKEPTVPRKARSAGAPPLAAISNVPPSSRLVVTRALTSQHAKASPAQNAKPPNTQSIAPSSPPSGNTPFDINQKSNVAKSAEQVVGRG
jgi:hypothetical protein